MHNMHLINQGNKLWFTFLIFGYVNDSDSAKKMRVFDALQGAG